MYRTAIALIAALMATPASADLLLYEPFDYTAGASLGGSGSTPVGVTNTHTGGGTWHARGTIASGYSAANDAAVAAGSMSYAGLLPGVGNSVSYGSATANGSLHSDSIDIPGADVTSGPLYASFIIRIKSNIPGTGTLRYSPAGLVTDATPPGTLGSDLTSASGTAVATPGTFWVRNDPTVAGLSNFSPSKSSGDGIGPGATGPSAGWQHSTTSGNIESNQFGAVNGQTYPTSADSSTYQTYFVVLKYTFDQMATTNGQNDTVSLWMNPGSGTLGQSNGEALASAAASGDVGSYYAAVNAFGTGALDVTAIRSFALFGHRQNTTNTMAIDFDELRIGTTWADVTPAVPESSHVMVVAAVAAVLGWLGRKKLIHRQPRAGS